MCIGLLLLDSPRSETVRKSRKDQFNEKLIARKRKWRLDQVINGRRARDDRPHGGEGGEGRVRIHGAFRITFTQTQRFGADVWPVLRTSHERQYVIIRRNCSATVDLPVTTVSIVNSIAADDVMRVALTRSNVSHLNFTQNHVFQQNYVTRERQTTIRATTATLFSK
jgi:hypothetical protein